MWAEKNQYFLDFSKLGRYQLGPEPDWVNPKREADILRNSFIKATPWTSREDNLLKELLVKQKYGYKELSQILCRSEGAIQRRINDLNIKYRPIKADNHQKWTESEYTLLGEMIKCGSKYEEISDRIGRSVKAIRGRVFDKYLTENLDKVRNYIGNGNFGDGTPDKPLKYKRLMSNEEKNKANLLLSIIAGDLRCVAKMNSNVDEEYSKYWQKDMCLNWSNIKGCIACEKDCDSCTSFKRIPVQHCKRCGKDFFERKSADFCSDCRSARLYQARKKYAILQQKQNQK